MIIIDSNIISSFCLINQFSLLFKLFPNQPFGIPPAVYDEIIGAIQLGYHFLETMRTLIDDDDVQLISLNPDEMRLKQHLPLSFGAGDIECIIVTRRPSHILLTNDRRVVNFCKSERTQVYDLPIILRAFWVSNILPRQKVNELILEIELKENMVIKSKKTILHNGQGI
jgi:hypothetical protein